MTCPLLLAGFTDTGAAGRQSRFELMILAVVFMIIAFSESEN